MARRHVDFRTKFLRKCRALSAVKRHAEQRQKGHRWVVQEYTSHHAVRKADVAKAIGLDRKVRRTTGVKGRGRYKTWTPQMMLRSALGRSCQAMAITHRFPRLQSKSPTMFSLNSLAYWTSSSTSHIANVRAALCEVFMDLMGNSLKSLQEATPFLTSVMLEFDAASFKLRMRSGMVEADARYQCLVQRCSLLLLQSDDSQWANTPLPICPAILKHEAAEGIWEALLRKHPISLFSWSSSSQIFVLRLVSDNASANTRMFRAFAIPSKPANCVLLHKICDQHSLNHCAEPIWKGMGVLTPMFYSTGFLSIGSNYFDLLKAAERWIMAEGTVKVIFEPPDPNVRRRNRALLELVLGPEVPNDPHWEVANHLLNLDTGSWGDAHIWHHCTGLFCCRTGIRETRLKIFTAVLDLIFKLKPVIPAVSRWTSCGKSARYYLLSMGYHNIIGRAFCGMHGRAPTSETLRSMQAESDEVMPIATFLFESAGGTGNGNMFHKVMRVKSWKMYQWLCDESSIFHVFCCCCVMQCLEHVMFSFMKWQEQDTWLIPGQSPLICMANMTTSPAARAILDLSHIMSASLFSTENVTLEDFLTGLPGGRCPDNFLDMLFWCLATGVGQTHRRLVGPYRNLPLSLAVLVDPLATRDSKIGMAKWFLELKECCLCSAFCVPLKRVATDETDMIEGKSNKVLQAAFQTKNTNIECETNFARAHSAKMATRGRNDFVQNMAAKHLLAEIKHCHKQFLERVRDGGEPSTPANIPLGPVDGNAIAPVQGDSPPEPAETRRKKYNGFTMYCALSKRVQDPGESKEECRKRVMNFCRDTWKAPGPEGEVLRREWQLKAVNHNRSEQAVVQLPTGRNGNPVVVADEQKISYIPPILTHQGGHGVLGIGDSSFGISVDQVAKVDESQKSFVRHYSSNWRRRAGGQEDLVDIGQSGTTVLSCQEVYGFCESDINDKKLFDTLVNHIIKYVVVYRRKHLVAGRNKGPNSAIQLPLLFMTANGGFPARAWLMASTSFSPYEAEMWEWEVSGGAHTADGVTTFFASPLWDDHSLPCMISHKRLALELSSLPDRHQRKWSVVAYEVLNLNKLKIVIQSTRDWEVPGDTVDAICSSDEERDANAAATALRSLLTASASTAQPKRHPRAATRGRGRKRKSTDDPVVDESHADPLPVEDEEDDSGEIITAWEMNHAIVNGRHVTVSTDVPSQPSSSRSASSKPAPTRVRQPTETSSDFEILDLDGNVEMRCDAKGYVYVHGRASSIGRITSWKEDSPGHSMSFACSLHKQCREAKAYRSLPQDFQVQAMRWMQMGLQITDRESGAAQHRKLFNALVMRPPP